ALPTELPGHGAFLFCHGSRDGGPTPRLSWCIKDAMLAWAAVFLIIAIVAALFGFGLVTAVAIGVAKILFAIFLILFLVTLIAHVSRRHT
ncbi:MAG: DUF1328 domain-containing protein, partial [Bradyrhizobium sp.]